MKKPVLPWRKRSATSSPGRWRRISDSLRRHWSAVALVGALVGFALASGSDAIENATKAWDWWKVDHRFTGRWTNNTEGHIEPPPDVASASGERVELALQVQRDGVTGDVHSARMCDVDMHAYMFIEGHRHWWGLGGVRAVVWDFRFGKRVVFAELEITYDSTTGNMDIRTTSPSPYFPDHVRLFRSSEFADSVSDKIEPFCPQFLERLNEKTRKPAQIPAPSSAGSKQRKPINGLTYGAESSTPTEAGAGARSATRAGPASRAR